MNKPTKNFTFVFDLDGTVVDTAHRYRDNAEGHCDLDFWFANSTPEMIARDTLLPLANAWKQRYAEGYEIVVCTARSWERDPRMTCEPGPMYERFLAENGLQYHALLYRNLVGPDHATLGDGDLKTRLLNEWAAREGKPSNWRERAIMFDDNRGVIRQMISDGLYCKDAVKTNAYEANLQRWAA